MLIHPSYHGLPLWAITRHYAPLRGTRQLTVTTTIGMKTNGYHNLAGGKRACGVLAGR